MQLGFLIAYAVIMCIIAVYSFRLKRNIVHFLVIAAYAFTGVICAICKIFQMSLLANNAFVAMAYDISNTTWWGYATLILCTVIALRPLKLFDDSDQLKSFGEQSSTQNFYIIFSVIYITLGLLFILTAFREVIRVINISD